MPSNLPKGIYYDKLRDRWRIRIYKNQKMLFTKYCATLEEALVIYEEGIKLKAQQEHRDSVPITPDEKFKSLYSQR